MDREKMIEMFNEIDNRYNIAIARELKIKKIIINLSRHFPILTDRQIASIVDMSLEYVKEVKEEARMKELIKQLPI